MCIYKLLRVNVSIPTCRWIPQELLYRNSEAERGAKITLSLLFSLVRRKGFIKTPVAMCNELGGPWCKCQKKKKIYIFYWSVGENGFCGNSLVALDLHSRGKVIGGTLVWRCTVISPNTCSCSGISYPRSSSCTETKAMPSYPAAAGALSDAGAAALSAPASLWRCDLSNSYYLEHSTSKRTSLSTIGWSWKRRGRLSGEGENDWQEG